jgi:hypothetical protein
MTVNSCKVQLPGEVFAKCFTIILRSISRWGVGGGSALKIFYKLLPPLPHLENDRKITVRYFVNTTPGSCPIQLLKAIINSAL